MSSQNTGVSAAESTVRPESYTVRYVKDGVVEARVPRAWLFVSQRDVAVNLVNVAVKVQ